MNFIDIILLIVIIALVITGFVFLIMGIVGNELGVGVSALGFFIFIAVLASIPFWVVDRKSGQTVGYVTSVDKNFFGTTAVYIKINESKEEEYCVENKDIANEAGNLIGKKVKITYGKRVGLYSTGKCSEAPIDSIELVEE